MPPPAHHKPRLILRVPVARQTGLSAVFGDRPAGLPPAHNLEAHVLKAPVRVLKDEAIVDDRDAVKPDGPVKDDRSEKHVHLPHAVYLCEGV
jgi:hypothetical protein